MAIWFYVFTQAGRRRKNLVKTLDKVGKIWYNIIVKRKKRGQNYEEKNQCLL